MPPILPNPPKSSDTFRPQTQAIKRMTPTYICAQHAKDLCYFCDEPFTMEHGLKTKKLQIHVMEVEEMT